MFPWYNYLSGLGTCVSTEKALFEAQEHQIAEMEAVGMAFPSTLMPASTACLKNVHWVFFCNLKQLEPIHRIFGTHCPDIASF